MFVAVSASFRQAGGPRETLSPRFMASTASRRGAVRTSTIWILPDWIPDLGVDGPESLPWGPTRIQAIYRDHSLAAAQGGGALFHLPKPGSGPISTIPSFMAVCRACKAKSRTCGDSVGRPAQKYRCELQRLDGAAAAPSRPSRLALGAAADAVWLRVWLCSGPSGVKSKTRYRVPGDDL
jgi:hypothetical protein